MLQKEKKTLQAEFKNKYFIFQTNIFQILTLFPQILLTWDIALITLLGILVRCCVGLSDFTADNTVALTGSMDNHRKWLDFSSKAPFKNFYFSKKAAFETDQPIVVGYHSFLMSFIGNYLFDGRNKSWFSVGKISTTEKAELQSFLRFTVCLTDMFMYIPPAIWFAKRFGRLVATKNTNLKGTAKTATSTFENAAIGHLKQLINFINSLIILLQPALLFIDHGLFGYHGFTLGALLLSINNCFDNKLGGACAFYILALCFDLNSIFCAPVFFLYFLRMTILSLGIFDFASIIITILSTLSLVYLPVYFFLDSRDEALKLLKNSISKISSMALFDSEKTPSKLWLFIQSRTISGRTLTNEDLKLCSLVCIAISIIPTCLFILSKCSKNNKPQSKIMLLYGLAACSIAFYLFSYELDHKSVLIPMLPLTLIIVKYNQINVSDKNSSGSTVNDKNRSLQTLFVIQNLSMYSIWPLVVQNGLFVQYFLIIFLYNWLFGGFNFHSKKVFDFFMNIIYLGLYLVMVASIVMDNPVYTSDKLRNMLHTFMFAFSHCCFFNLWLWMHYKMWNI